MSDKQLRITEGWAVAAGVVAAGLVLQLLAGPFRWEVFAFPVNVIVCAAFITVGVCIFLFRKKSPVLEFLGSLQAAVPAMTAAAVLTVIMGLTRQVPSGMKAPGVFGFRSMLTSWPFVLSYIYMEIILLQVILKEITSWRWNAFPSLVFHAGFFTVLLAGSMGSPDMAMLEMEVNRNAPQWSASDEAGEVRNLPLGIQLLGFDIAEYPPKLALSAADGKPLHDPARTITVDSTFSSGSVGSWKVSLKEYIETAAPSEEGYVCWPSPGSACALLLSATDGSSEHEGWVFGGSYLFPKQGLELAEGEFLFMRPRMPRRFEADVQVLTKAGKSSRITLAVNEPFSIDGWKIYLADYDARMGRWSDTCVLELVKDPWLPAVYAGIFMMLAGAALMLFIKRR